MLHDRRISKISSTFLHKICIANNCVSHLSRQTRDNTRCFRTEAIHHIAMSCMETHTYVCLKYDTATLSREASLMLVDYPDVISITQP